MHAEDTLCAGLNEDRWLGRVDIHRRVHASPMRPPPAPPRCGRCSHTLRMLRSVLLSNARRVSPGRSWPSPVNVNTPYSKKEEDLQVSVNNHGPSGRTLGEGVTCLVDELSHTDVISRSDILSQLRQLQTISVGLELLLARVRAGERLSEEERVQMESLAVQQGRIVDLFVSMSTDVEGIRRYEDATRQFQLHLQVLETSQDAEQLVTLRDDVSVAVDAWVQSLEHIIRDALTRVP